MFSNDFLRKTWSVLLTWLSWRRFYSKKIETLRYTKIMKGLCKECRISSVVYKTNNLVVK